MNEIVSLFSNPLVWKLLVSYWVVSAFVGALPTPKENSNPFYQWAFRFCHILAGNLNRAAVKFQVPGADAGPSANDKS